MISTPPNAVLALGLLLSACSGNGSAADASPDGGTDTDPEFEPDLPFADCEIEWEHVYEIPGTNSTRTPSLVALDNGHFVLVGQATFNSGPDQGLILEVDEDGEIVWFDLMRDEGFDEFFEYVYQVDDGFMLMGLTMETGELSCWVARTTEEAAIVWSEVIPGFDCIGTYQQPDGNVLFSNTPPKIGEIKPSGEVNTYNFDSLGVEYFTTGVIGFSNGQSALTGFFHETETDVKRALIVTIGADHTLLEVDIDDSFFETTLGPALENTSGDYFIAGGWAEFGDGAFFQKVGLDGWVLWRRFVGNQGGSAIRSLLPSSSEFIFVGKTKLRDGYMGRIDKDGHLVWHFSHGYVEEDGFSDVVQTEDGGYVIAGTTLHDPPDASALRASWLIKMNQTEECY